MKAMLLHGVSHLQENAKPLMYSDIDDPHPGTGEILIRVSACGVCHTELDEIEGRTPPPRYPVVPGHQVVGRVVAARESAHHQPVHNRGRAQWSDDLQFETPSGDIWKPVPKIYNFYGWATLYDPVAWTPAQLNAHEQLVDERSDGARMKIKNYNHLLFDEEGTPTVRMQVWDCILTRPGK